MKPDKVIKNEWRPKFWKNPEKYFPVKVLADEGFHRNACKKCRKPFWSTDAKRNVCGDPACSGEGFSFIGNTPAKRKLDYVEVWLEFSSMFRKLGYTPVKRYPVVARWNPTMEYTNASIAAFQPYVISGEVEPPANPLVIPQFCLRFSDIDNVGITQSHNTGFVMIGQHMFVKPKDWDQEKVFRDIHEWNRKGLGLPNEELTYHEDAWAGGGNLGCCMEFFSRGCELGNQVYMLYEQTQKGVRELGLKVLDMGMGQERNAWFSQGCETIYEATFPDVLKRLMKKSGVSYDRGLMARFVPNAGLLNLDETSDVNKSWNEVAKLTGVGVHELKDFILPLSGIYSIAEHMRSLLFVLSDGALPSNAGGGYNLRALARRAFAFRDRFGWDFDFGQICRWHADYLRPIFPELRENLDDIGKILKVEEVKYRETAKKSSDIIRKLKGRPEIRELVKMYSSFGITPEMVREEYGKRGIEVTIPEDFYSRVTAGQEKENAAATVKEKTIPLPELQDTQALYFDDYKKTEFSARVLKVSGNYAVLDKTAFYPTSGGQIHDKGSINGQSVRDVFKQGNLIIHEMEGKPAFREGGDVKGKIEWGRREILSQHHTATHIVNAAARRVLGSHVNQAGARKTEEYSYLDITHYDTLDSGEIRKIEDEANRIAKRGLSVNKFFLPRGEAEKRFGMSIYQGGAVPGKMIRIVDIQGVDAEACGGTHLNNTAEAGVIKILRSKKIQDGVIRIEFTAGSRASGVSSQEKTELENIIIKMNGVFRISGKPEGGAAEYLREGAKIFSVPADQVEKTVEKFVSELKEDAEKLQAAGIQAADKKDFNARDLGKAFSCLFDSWKEQKKRLEKSSGSMAEAEGKRLLGRMKSGKVEEAVDFDRKDMIKICDWVINNSKATVILVNTNGDVVGGSSVNDMSKIMPEFCRKYGGSGGGRGRLGQGKIDFTRFRKTG